MASRTSCPEGVAGLGSSITPTPAPAQAGGKLPPGLAFDKPAEALGEIGNPAPDGTMWVRPDIPVVRAGIRGQDVPLGHHRHAPALDLYPQRVPVKEALELYQGIA